MKYTKTSTVDAFQFTEKEIKSEEVGAELTPEQKKAGAKRKVRRTFEGAEVRGEGDAAFITHTVSGNDFKLSPGQWLVTEASGVSVWNDEDFKKSFTKASNQKETPKTDAEKAGDREPVKTSVDVPTPTIQPNKNAWTPEQVAGEPITEEEVKEAQKK